MVNANTKFTMTTTNAQLAARNAARQKQSGSGKSKVRYVRTAAGQKRYGRSIGDVIVAGKKLENIKHEDPVYPGWDLIKGKNGVKYDVGKMRGKFVAYVHNAKDGLAITANSHEELLTMLNSRVTKVKQTIKPTYDRLGKEKQTAPDGTPIEDEEDTSSTSARSTTTSRSSRSSSASSSRTSAASTREARAKKAAREAETKRKAKARKAAAARAEKGEYEGSSLSGLRQLVSLAMGTGGKDSAQNRRHSEALMKILQRQGLIQPATKKSTARKDPLAERKGKVPSDTRKWEPAEGFTMSQVARSIAYDVNIDRILFQWDEDRRNSKG